ncbi:ATP-binding protein [Fusobacterium sp.]|uniref:ATP-binding protein n=1 Tax=Fusobacterium sp. TaxID=68766 RepID=UPI001DBFD4F0|nr:ATP-binding protein [Fusobacterium sp.]MBS5790703.1 ATP-binding protein [Fusobacterium sp.]MDY3059210.1 ATP-binding protein [Fusobacterium sp.]
MKIAVLSGKGGTGKTTVSSSLALISKMLLIDTDIEEPNSHIFLKGNVEDIKSVYTRFPEVNMEKCNLCGECGNFCKFNAIIPAKKRVIVFGEACHDCGGCEIVCKNGAISWEKREIGKIYTGKTHFNSINKYGELNIGEMSGVKIIKEIYKNTEEKDFLIDCPPGTACTTVSAVEVADFAIIVVEPSPFGLSDMKLVVQLLRDMKIPFGVVINKFDEDENIVKKYCDDEKIEIIGTIPFDRKIAETYSKGEIIAEALPEYRENFETILKRVKSYGN